MSKISAFLVLAFSVSVALGVSGFDTTITREPPLLRDGFVLRGVDGKLSGRYNEQQFSLHKAVGAKVTYTNKYHSNYPASGELGLVDGINSPASFNRYFWQGFEGIDFEAIIELNKEIEISKISVGCSSVPVFSACCSLLGSVRSGRSAIARRKLLGQQ